MSFQETNKRRMLEKDNARLYEINMNLERKAKDYFDELQHARKETEKWKNEYFKILKEMQRRNNES